MELDLLVRGGTAVLPGGARQADVGIREGRIAAVSPPGGALERSPRTRVVDAGGLLVLPGGVDPHVHLDIHQNGAASADDFPAGTASAAAGGTTTVIDFAQAMGEESPAACIAQRREEARGAAVDYAFHFAFTQNWRAQLSGLADVIRAGITSYKLFTCYPGLGLDEGEMAAVLGALPPEATALVHGEAPEWLSEPAPGPGPAALRQARARPGEAEMAAVERLIRLSGGAPVPLCLAHASTAGAVALVRAARAGGKNVALETCPQYLYFTAGDYGGRDGELLSATPPLRGEADRQALWAGLLDGSIDLVSTDHCPFPAEDKRRAAAQNRPLNGVGGVGLRLSLLYSGGVAERGMSLERFTDLVSANAARRYGLYPRKGCLAPGADGDLALFDPAASWDPAELLPLTGEDHTVYAGRTLRGRTVRTFLRGAEIFNQAEGLAAPPGAGQYLARG